MNGENLSQELKNVCFLVILQHKKDTNVFIQFK